MSRALTERPPRRAHDEPKAVGEQTDQAAVEAPQGDQPSAAQLLALQQTAGNAAVTRYLRGLNGATAPSPTSSTAAETTADPKEAAATLPAAQPTDAPPPPAPSAAPTEPAAPTAEAAPAAEVDDAPAPNAPLPPFHQPPPTPTLPSGITVQVGIGHGQRIGQFVPLSGPGVVNYTKAELQALAKFFGF